MSSFVEGQIHQLADALEAAGFDANHLTRMGQSRRRLLLFRDVLDGKAEINFISDPTSDIHVDRLGITLSYPDECIPFHPELERLGPADYNLERDIQRWRHPLQKQEQESDDFYRVERVYEFLKSKGELANHAGLEDLWALQDKGLAVFRKHFAGRVVLAWRSVFHPRSNKLCMFVPVLVESNGELLQTQMHVSSPLNSHCVALRFKQ